MELEKEDLENLEKKIANFTKHFFEEKCPEGCECEKGCCEDCDLKNGYLYAPYGFKVEGIDYVYHSPLPKEKFRELKKEYDFDNLNGFWTENGCKLPRHKRSIACLMFACSDIREDFEDFDMIFKNLAKLLLNIRKRKYKKIEG